jgi:ABC-type transport system substrate-binding protein
MFTTATITSNIAQQFEGLFARDMKYAPAALAEEYKVPTRQGVRVQLRKGVKFHNGKALSGS